MNRRDVLSGTAAGLAFGGGFVVTYETLWRSPTPGSVARLEVNSEDSPRPGDEGGPQYYAEQPPEVEVDGETKTIYISGYLYVGSVDHDLKVESLSYDETTEALMIEMTGYLPLRTGLDYLTGVDRIDRRKIGRAHV